MVGLGAVYQEAGQITCPHRPRVTMEMENWKRHMESITGIPVSDYPVQRKRKRAQPIDASALTPTYHGSPDFDYEDWERFSKSGEIPF